MSELKKLFDWAQAKQRQEPRNAMYWEGYSKAIEDVIDMGRDMPSPAEEPKKYTCYECGGEVSTLEKRCHHCGVEVE